MEILGAASLPAGRPAAVYAAGRTQVFAIGAGGVMYRWTSTDGVAWQGPEELPRFGTALEASYPCAIAVGNAVHVFGIGHGPLFSSGGPLVRWSSSSGISFSPAAQDYPPGWAIPGAGNGIALCAAGASAIDAYAVTSAGVGRYAYAGTGTLQWQGIFPLPPAPVAGALPPCVPAAIHSGVAYEVFARSADGRALRWRSTDRFAWGTSILPRPSPTPVGTVVGGGFTAVASGPGRVELFAVMSSGGIANWSLDGTSVTSAVMLPFPPLRVHDSIPFAVVVDRRIEVFAIGVPPNPFTGGPLLRWTRFLDGGSWSSAKVVGASLSAGGLSAVISENGRIDAFGLGGGGLHHWPAGIRAAGTQPWANWANSRQMNPTGHCYPDTEEEVVAIVRTAERVPGARVRSVGSSWSFTDITMPSQPGFIVETNAMKGLIRHVIDREVLTDAWKSHADRLIHVEAGIQVEQLMRRMDEMGLAPFTLGGSSGQTIAGVISTSVHGAHWDRGPIPDAVRALQIVGPGGARFWIEPDQWRITVPERLGPRLGPGITIKYDDDWFDAALVAMGSLGVITSVVLEATEQYFLEKTCSETTWQGLRPQLQQGTLFADPDHYTMIAIDPAATGDRPCYVTRAHRSAGPAQGSPGAPNPLVGFCECDFGAALGYFGTLGVAIPTIDAIVLAATATLGAFGILVPPIPAGATFAAAMTILVPVLRAAGPGALGDFVGSLLNQSSELAAGFATWLTREMLKPGSVSVDLAHRVLAPADLSACASRGHALELAFDATSDRYLAFLDEAMGRLDQRRAQGMILGGWLSLRFVGPSRAILSPQQSARTCMIEMVGLRSLQSTLPLLDEMEKLGRSFGAIQHWGMHSSANLSAADLPAAFPRLDSWKRVRRELTRNGSLRTFDNAFTARMGLEDAPASAPLLRQDGWRWCRNCLGMAFGGGAPGPCPAGGTHDLTASGNYAFAHNAPWVPGQRGWRWCRKCAGMVMANGGGLPCPAGGAHDLTASGTYTIPRNGQTGWHFCARCQGLAYQGAGAAPCPAGGTHVHPWGSYWLPIAPREATRGPAPVPAMAVGGKLDAIGIIPAIPILRIPLTREIAHSLPEVPGERDWRRCTSCQSLTHSGGRCAGGAAHTPDTGTSFILPLNRQSAPGQAHWRRCAKCQTLVFREGPCFAGGTHDLTGSGDYTLRGSAQQSWRHCRNCGGLWFSGNGGTGRCPAPGGAHDMGVDDYVAGGMDWTG
jgi:hypothetical protein